ncbi:MAG: hypothetical protein EOM50_00950 [Erysipelotrichia bacterium]|nr:hypothetical protein [Erysipelotrichia bacterium]NCC54333.1 hypothetical protein [Erysipelotrichia bacterium]
MNNLKSLIFVQLKCSFGGINYGEKKNKLNILIYIILGVCFLPTILMFYQLFKTGFMFASQIHQEGVIFLAGFQLVSLFIFVFSLFLIPSIYYFSKDINTLLALPLNAQSIITSKFFVCMLYELLFSILTCIPLLISYLQVSSLTLPLLLFMMIAILTLPIYPLVLSSILTMLIMRFAPFMQNRDHFNIIGSILVLAFSFAISYGLGQIDTLDQSQLIALLQEGNNSLLSIFSYLFFAIPFLVKAIINTDFIALLIYLGITLFAFIIFMYIAKTVYFAGVIGVEESSSSKKQLSKQALHKQLQRRSILSTYIKKEFHLLFRTPVYLMNCIVMALLPALMILITLFTSDLSQLIHIINQGALDFFIKDTNFIYFIAIAGLLCGIACGNLNLIAATAISREGSNYIFMKYIPVDLQTQINAKVGCGAITSIVSILLPMIPVCLLIRLPILAIVVFLFCAMITTILANYLGFLIDLLHPKLIWEQEAAAVKQNINGAIALFGGVAIAISIGFLAFYIPKNTLPMFTIAITLVLSVLTIVLYLYIHKIVDRIFNKL